MCVTVILRRPGQSPQVARNFGEFAKAMGKDGMVLLCEPPGDPRACLCPVDFGNTVRAQAAKASYDPDMECWDLTLPATH